MRSASVPDVLSVEAGERGGPGGQADRKSAASPPDVDVLAVYSLLGMCDTAASRKFDPDVGASIPSLCVQGSRPSSVSLCPQKQGRTALGVPVRRANPCPVPANGFRGGADRVSSAARGVGRGRSPTERDAGGKRRSTSRKPGDVPRRTAGQTGRRKASATPARRSRPPPSANDTDQPIRTTRALATTPPKTPPNSFAV